MRVLHLLKPRVPFDLLLLKTAEAGIVLLTLLLTRDEEERGGDGATPHNTRDLRSFPIIAPKGEFLRYAHTIWEEEIG